jgi:hypothetical protein
MGDALKFQPMALQRRGVEFLRRAVGAGSHRTEKAIEENGPCLFISTRMRINVAITAVRTAPCCISCSNPPVEPSIFACFATARCSARSRGLPKSSAKKIRDEIQLEESALRRSATAAPKIESAQFSKEVCGNAKTGYSYSDDCIRIATFRLRYRPGLQVFRLR